MPKVCAVNGNHKVIPISWEKKEAWEKAVGFMCEHCFRMFHLDEINDYHKSALEFENLEL